MGIDAAVIAIDKPAGLTSFQVVNRVRRIFGVKKAGHTGTLDPAATGLLVVCLGRATRLAQFITQGDKVYEGTLTLGIMTDSYDAEGQIVETRPLPDGLSRESIAEMASRFIGTIEQAPPPFSAAKHKGVPLYKLARKGIEIKKEPRKVEVFSFEITSVDLPHVGFRINCSKGTYIRSIAHDLGQLIGCGAILSGLRRTRSGHITIEEAVGLEELRQRVEEAGPAGLVRPVDWALSHVPGILVNNRDALKLVQGQGMTSARLQHYLEEQAPALLQARPEVLRIMALNREKKPILAGLVAWPEDDFRTPSLVKVMRVWASPADIPTPTDRSARAAIPGSEIDRKKRLIS